MSYTRIEAPTRKHPPISPGKAFYQTPNGLAFVDLDYQKTGYGKKAFLVCPMCGKRRQYLIVCRNNVCCNDHLLHNGTFKGGHYNGIQYTTKGGMDRIAYTMKKIAEKNYIPFRVGDDPTLCLIRDQRPRYMRKRKFADVIARLNILDELRCTAIIKTFPFGKRTAAHLENNVPIIALIERCSIEELSQFKKYAEEMSFAQTVYKQDWGFPKENAV